MDKPLVSILINNYNYGRFLREAIDSALNQTYPHVEVVVVDDGSTDESRDIIASYGDRIKSILKENGGQASAFNAGFINSRGGIVCFLDSDDIFTLEKSAEIVHLFDSDQDIGWCFHPQVIADTKDKLVSRVDYKPTSAKYDLIQQMRRGRLGNPFEFPIPATSGMCFRRSLLQKILPMPESDGITLNDSYIKFAALGISKGAALDAELSVQRIHGGNAFTFKDNRQQLARFHVLLAYWLRAKFPTLTKFANNLFATGIMFYQQIGGVEIKYQATVKEYLVSLPLLQRLQVKLKVFFYLLREGKSRL